MRIMFSTFSVFILSIAALSQATLPYQPGQSAPISIPNPEVPGSHNTTPQIPETNPNTQSYQKAPAFQMPGSQKTQEPLSQGQEEEDLADRRSNEFDYNLYDRQQNRIDQNQRMQQQQYYYQQSPGGYDNSSDTQYNRTKTQRTQYFNPRDE